MILDTLSNGLKDLFAALGAKTSDSNYAVPLLNKTNGTPQGMMDMASLASVLGADRWNAKDSTNIDLNTVKNVSFYFGDSFSTANNAPINGKGALCSFIYASQGFHLFCDTANNVLYFRRCYGSFATWKTVSAT